MALRVERYDVAAATRLMVAEEILDYSGHVSVRVPGREALVIQDGATSRAEVTPERMLVVGFDGTVLAGEGKPPLELVIHSEIYRARPDVGAVLHSHLDLAIAFTMMQGVTLLPMRARAARWKTGIPTDPDPSHINYPDQGRALAKTLGPHHAALMRAHGMVLVAENARALLVDAVHFQENARAMFQVLQAGARPLPLTEAEIAIIEGKEVRDWHVRKLWTYYAGRGVASGVLPRDWRED